MPPPERFRGILAPVVTPFRRDLSPDAERLIRHCRWLLSCRTGLAVFGTNSEGNSLSVGEKIDLLDRLVDAGIEPGRLMPGTGCCALTDTLRLTRHAVQRRCGGVLVLPPFYYKNVEDDGLFRYYSEIVERVGSDALAIYLYHIPPVAQVGLSIPLIERLVRAYPDTIAGIKDSSGDWNVSRTLLERRWDDFRVFSGSETFLLRNLEAGGAGCISAVANINPGPIERLYREYRTANAASLQQGLDNVRAVLQQYPMIAALKATIAHFRDDPSWSVVRPPLTPLRAGQEASLIGQLRERQFEMPG